MGKLIYTSTTEMSADDWLAFRKCGIGASEVGALMGLSQYKSNVELFYDKIGQGLGFNVENIAMFMGTELEDFIAKMWQYWNGSEASLIENFRAGNRVRKMERVNAYIQNSAMPWLFVSLDRKINKYTDDSGKERGNGALEIKTISGYEADKWDSGIPPSYVVQVQTQLLVTEWKYGELAVLRDGRFFEVFPFDKHAGVCREIKKQTKEFWQRVLAARKALTQKFEAQKNFNTAKVRELEAELQRLEPDADNSEGLAKFLKDKFKIAEPESIREGTLEDLDSATKHAQISLQIKNLNKDKQLYENRLKTRMREFERLDFGAAGSVLWKNDVNGTRRFQNKIKLPESN